MSRLRVHSEPRRRRRFPWILLAICASLIGIHVGSHAHPLVVLSGANVAWGYTATFSTGRIVLAGSHRFSQVLDSGDVFGVSRSTRTIVPGAATLRTVNVTRPNSLRRSVHYQLDVSLVALVLPLALFGAIRTALWYRARRCGVGFEVLPTEAPRQTY